MTQSDHAERALFQVLVALLAVICFLIGGAAGFGGIHAISTLTGTAPLLPDNAAFKGFIDNEIRFGFGVFFTQGLILLYSLSDIKRHALLFRAAALAIFIGGLGRLSNFIEFGLVDINLLGPLSIELIAVPILVVWHVKIVHNEKRKLADNTTS